MTNGGIRQSAAVLAFAMLLAVSPGVPARTLLEELQACGDIAHDQQRLRCFDDVLYRARQPGAAPAAAQGETAVDVPAPDKAHGESADQFGKEHWAGSGDKADDLEATVTAVGKSAYGELVITLDNGQVWRQREMRRMSIRAGDRVVIERGSFNSFYLTAGENSRRERFYRVE